MPSQYEQMMQRLEEDIARVGNELENLLVTRKTMEKLYQQTIGATAPLSMISHATKTTRKKRASSPDRLAWGDIREKIFEIIKASPEPMRSGEIRVIALADVSHPSKKQSDRVYGVLKELRDQLRITRTDDKRYRVMTYDERETAAAALKQKPFSLSEGEQS